MSIKLLKALAKICNEASNLEVYIFVNCFWWLGKKPTIVEMSLLSVFLIFEKLLSFLSYSCERNNETLFKKLKRVKRSCLVNIFLRT